LIVRSVPTVARMAFVMKSITIMDNVIRTAIVQLATTAPSMASATTCTDA